MSEQIAKQFLLLAFTSSDRGERMRWTQRATEHLDRRLTEIQSRYLSCFESLTDSEQLDVLQDIYNGSPDAA